MQRYFLFILMFLFLLNINAQDSTQHKNFYKLRLSTEIPIASVVAGTGISSFFLYKKKQGLTQDQINNSSPLDVNKFDRYAIYQHSKPAAIASDVFQYTAMGSPAFLFIDKKIRKDWKTVLPIWIETFAITTTLTLFTKEIVKRNRPYVYSDFNNGSKYSKSARSSFFSGHTSITAASTFFIASIYTDYHPNSKFLPLIWTGAAIFPALTALTRVKAGKHYWTDVIVGYAVGALVGGLTPYIHRRIFKNKKVKIGL